MSLRLPLLLSLTGFLLRFLIAIQLVPEQSASLPFALTRSTLSKLPAFTQLQRLDLIIDYLLSHIEALAQPQTLHSTTLAQVHPT